MALFRSCKAGTIFIVNAGNKELIVQKHHFTYPKTCFPLYMLWLCFNLKWVHLAVLVKLRIYPVFLAATHQVSETSILCLLPNKASSLSLVGIASWFLFLLLLLCDILWLLEEREIQCVYNLNVYPCCSSDDSFPLILKSIWLPYKKKIFKIDEREATSSKVDNLVRKTVIHWWNSALMEKVLIEIKNRNFIVAEKSLWWDI